MWAYFQVKPLSPGILLSLYFANGTLRDEIKQDGDKPKVYWEVLLRNKHLRHFHM